MSQQNITIRFALEEDIPAVMDFIKNEWNSNHILANNSEFMKYQHLQNHNFTFAIAQDSTYKKIYGVCGYIQANQTDHPDIWLALWKALKCSDSMLGIQIIEFIKKQTKCRLFACCGINRKVMGIYRFLGYDVGSLNHFYRLSDKNIDEYAVAKVEKKNILPITKSNSRLIQYNCFDELLHAFPIERYQNHIPYKDVDYLRWRYFEHPIYNYKVYGIDCVQHSIISLLVTREIVQNNVKILRIVDFIGEQDDLSYISEPIQRIIENELYEYVDFYCYGIDAQIMEAAGFSKRCENDHNIIPNYFEPFVKANVDIYFATNDLNQFSMFKADGDQDRPNFL